MAGLLGQLGYAAKAEDLPRRLKRFSGKSSGRAFVAEENGKVLGLIALPVLSPLHMAGLWGRVSAIVVAEEARGKGVGRALLGEGEAYFRGLGCAQVEVTSAPGREKAHGFYAGNGYEEKPRRFLKTLAGGDVRGNSGLEITARPAGVPGAGKKLRSRRRSRREKERGGAS